MMKVNVARVRRYVEAPGPDSVIVSVPVAADVGRNCTGYETVEDRFSTDTGATVSAEALYVNVTVTSPCSDVEAEFTSRFRFRIVFCTTFWVVGSNENVSGISGRTASGTLFATLNSSAPCTIVANSVERLDADTPESVTVESFTPGAKVTVAAMPPSDPLTPPYVSCTTTLLVWYSGGWPSVSDSTTVLLTYTKPLLFWSRFEAGSDSARLPFGNTGTIA